MAFWASAATSSTGLLTASRRAWPASLHMAELVNSLISSGCWVRISAKSNRPCLCSSVLFILRVPCSLLTTNSIPTSKWNGRGQGSVPSSLLPVFKGEGRGSGQHTVAGSPPESAALNMPANLENSAVATGLEKVSFYSNPKDRQCQKMLKLLHICTHLTR